MSGSRMKLCVLALIILLITCARVCFAERYVVEVLSVVDNKVIQNYISEIPGAGSYGSKRTQAIENVNNDIKYIYGEINQMFSTLSSQGLDIEIQQRHLSILDTNVFTARDLVNGVGISSFSSLTLFENYLTAQDAYRTFKYDCAILYTGFDIFGETGFQTAGYAHVGKVCDSKQAISVVEFNATYVTVQIAAHEIAHILGASHDGIASEKAMAASTNPLHKNRWFFGDCTVSDITEFLPLLSSNCLLQTNPASVLYKSSWATYNGQMLNPNTICKRTLNDNRSYMCLANVLYNNMTAKGDQVCQHIYCRIPGTEYCKPTFAPEGMICDKNKRCNNGRCVPDSSPAAAAVDANSVMGDQETVEFTNPTFQGTCAEFIVNRGTSMCNSNVVRREVCTKTCQRVCTGPAGCECGDRSIECLFYTRASVCPTYGSDICCGYCRGFVSKRSTSENVTPKNIIVIDDSEQPSVTEKEYPVNSTVNSD